MTKRAWWVRRTGEREPVVYVADVDRLKRDASALLAACKAQQAAIRTILDEAGKGPATDWRVVNEAGVAAARAIDNAEVGR